MIDMGNLERTTAMPRRLVLQFPEPRRFLVGGTCSLPLFGLMRAGTLLNPLVESTCRQRREMALATFLLVGAIHGSCRSMTWCLKQLRDEGVHQFARS